MVVPDGEREAAGRDAHAVIDEAKAGGVYVFGGGIDENVPPVRVSADGRVVESARAWGQESSSDQVLTQPGELRCTGVERRKSGALEFRSGGYHVLNAKGRTTAPYIQYHRVILYNNMFGKIFVSDCSHSQRKSVWPNI